MEIKNTLLTHKNGSFFCAILYLIILIAFTFGLLNFNDLWMLTSIIGMPILLALTIGYLTFSFKSEPKNYFEVFKLKPDSGLANQSLFWIFVLIPISLFLILGGVAWNGYEFDISRDGFDKFYEISKLPLAILTLSLPLGLVIVRMHSTGQTASQIKDTISQRKIENSVRFIENNTQAFKNISKSIREKFTIIEEQINSNMEINDKCSNFKDRVSTSVDILEQGNTVQQSPYFVFDRKKETHIKSYLENLSASSFHGSGEYEVFLETTIQVAKHIQAADFVYKTLLHEIDKIEKKHRALKEHFYLPNTLWLEIDDIALITYHSCNAFWERKHDLFEYSKKEIVTYRNFYENYLANNQHSFRRYFGFVL